MLRVIGNRGCSRCEITKSILDGKKIDYTYEYLSDLPQEEQNRLSEMAREQGKLAMPLIFRDSTLIDTKEV